MAFNFPLFCRYIFTCHELPIIYLQNKIRHTYRGEFLMIACLDLLNDWLIGSKSDTLLQLVVSIGCLSQYQRFQRDRCHIPSIFHVCTTVRAVVSLWIKRESYGFASDSRRLTLNIHQCLELRNLLFDSI